MPPEIFKIELPVAFFFFVFALSYHCKFIINRVLTRETWASLLIALNSSLVVTITTRKSMLGFLDNMCKI